MSKISFPPIFISSNPEILKSALSEFEYSATVEAEYGDTVVEGTIATLAHHVYPGNPPPCTEENWSREDASLVEAIGVSHVDLDCLGGILTLLGKKPNMPSFWKVAGRVDTEGPHRLPDILFEEGIYHQPDDDPPAPSVEAQMLDAFWAISQDYKVSAPEEDGVKDISSDFNFVALAEGLLGIFDAAYNGDDPCGYFAAGREWRSSLDKLEEESFVQWEGSVMIRISSSFVNAFYRHEGRVAQGIAALNTKTGGVTLSLEDPKYFKSVSCKDIVQKLWGPEAGGHKGIAGSPRGQRMKLEDLLAAAKALREAISACIIGQLADSDREALEEELESLQGCSDEEKVAYLRERGFMV